MTLQVVGAGLGRTGTLSLKLALEQLLDGPCYHMLEVFGHLDDHVEAWHRAVKGEAYEWDVIFDGYRAAVDWPTAAFWRELADAFPDALVILSERDGETWWRSADRTIFEGFRAGGDDPPPEIEDWHAMATDLLTERFCERFLERDAAISAFEAHNDEVRATIPADRLLEWRPGDGWEPICTALELPVPEEPFPHVNSTEEFRSRAGYDA